MESLARNPKNTLTWNQLGWGSSPFPPSIHPIFYLSVLLPYLSYANLILVLFPSLHLALTLKNLYLVNLFPIFKLTFYTIPAHLRLLD